MTYNINLHGKADADDVRAAFEDLVRALRSDTDEPLGTLTVDSVPYDSDDVPDEATFDEEPAEEPAEEASDELMDTAADDGTEEA